MNGRRHFLFSLFGTGLFGCARGQDNPAAAKKEYEAALAEARRAGIPLTMQGVQGPMPPDAQNAASLYRALKKRHPSGMGGKGTPFEAESIRVFLPGGDVSAWRDYFHRDAEDLRLVHQAAKRPQCVFPLPAGDPNKIVFEGYSEMRGAARLLRAESLLLARDGHGPEAVRTLAQAFQIGRHVAQGHWLISYLVAVVIDAITLSGMQQLCWLQGQNAAVMEQIAQTVALSWRPHSLTRALQGEMTFQYLATEVNRAKGPNSMKALLAGEDADENEMEAEDKALLAKTRRMDTREWNAFLDANTAASLRYTQRMADAADRPYPQTKAAFDALFTAIEKDRAHLLATRTLPVFSQVNEKRAEILARAHLTQAGAMILVWRQRHGKWPKALPGTLPRVPLDPFDGKPVRYRQEGNGFCVYSIGASGKFDGGVPTKKPATVECLFRYPLPPYMK